MLFGFLAPVWKPAPRRHRCVDAELTQAASRLLGALGLGGLARRVAVCWHARLTSTAGLAKPSEALVLLNPRLRDFPSEIDRTLRHELAHLVAFARAGRGRTAPHGAEWQRACSDLGISGEARCHNLPLPRRRENRPHVYRCPACEFILRRARPINTRRRRLACRDCCNRHTRGKFDRRFEFVRIRAGDDEHHVS